MVEYGRTSQEGLAASGFDPQDVEAARRWRNSAFYHMLQTGAEISRFSPNTPEWAGLFSEILT